MSERCSWCVSPARAVAEEAIADGVEIAEVARSYGLSRDQWYKHRRHGTRMSPTSLASVRLEVIEGGGGPYTVIPRLEALLLQVDGLKDRWGEKPQVTVALLRLERDVLGDIAKLRGEFPDNPACLWISCRSGQRFSMCLTVTRRLAVTLWKRCTVETDLLSASLDPASFATWASRGTWETADHLEYLNTQLLSLASGEFDRLSVAMPPRHGKSFLCSWFFPAWFLLRYPTKRVLLVSYEADFAATWGRRVRDTVAEHGDRFGVQVKSDSKAASRFDLTAGGGMSTAGIGGPITGKGGDLVIIDDPVKNYAEAVSPTISNAQWDWYQTTLRTRLEPGARILLVMTRWAETDLSSRVVEGDEAWVDVRLPAFAEDDDPLGRDVGDALWPARFDVAALSKTRDALSGSHWSALYQGRPTPLDGDVFRKDWFTYWWNDDDGGMVTDNGPVELVETFMTVDLAISTKQSADPTVMAVWGRDKVDRLFLLDLYRKRVPGPTQVRALQRLDAEWNPHLILIEDVAYQRAFIQHAAQKGLPVKGVRPDGNKLARAIPAADMLETGRMFLPLIAKWLHIAEQELLAFPNGKHDDIVDVLSYAAMHVQAKRRRTKLVGWKLDPALTKPSMNI